MLDYLKLKRNVDSYQLLKEERQTFQQTNSQNSIDEFRKTKVTLSIFYLFLKIKVLYYLTAFSSSGGLLFKRISRMFSNFSFHSQIGKCSISSSRQFG